MNSDFRSAPPAIHNLPRLSVPAPVVTTLPGGMRLVMLDAGEMEVSRLSIMRTGGTVEAPLPEIPLLCTEVMREGSASLTGAQIADRLDYNGAWVKSSGHAHHQSTVLFSLNANAAEVLPVVADFVAHPVFDPHATAMLAEKTAAKAEIDAQKVAWHASNALTSLVKGAANPAARVSTPEQIRAVDSEMLRRWHAEGFNPSAFTLFLAGRLSDRLVGDVTRIFSQFEAVGPGIEAVYPANEPAGSLDEIHIDMPGSLQSAVAMGMPSIPRSHPDYVPLRLAVMALGGYFGSRLMLNVREDKGYTYGIGAALLGGREGSMIKITTECDNSYTRAVIDEVRREVSRLANPATFTPDEIDRLRRYVTTTLAASIDSPFAMMDYYETQLLADTPADYLDRQQDAIQSLSPDMIATMAARYMDPARLYTAVAGA